MQYGTKVTIEQDAENGDGGGESHPILAPGYRVSCLGQRRDRAPVWVEQSQKKAGWHCGEGSNDREL